VTSVQLCCRLQAQEALQEERSAHAAVRRTLLGKDVEIGQLKGEVRGVLQRNCTVASPCFPSECRTQQVA
jgi:hypothetical protein